MLCPEALSGELDETLDEALSPKSIPGMDAPEYEHEEPTVEPGTPYYDPGHAAPDAETIPACTGSNGSPSTVGTNNGSELQPSQDVTNASLGPQKALEPVSCL